MLVISQPTAAGAVLSKKGGAACWCGPGAALPAQPSLCLAPFQGPVSGVVQQGLRAPLRHGAGEDPRFLPSTEPKRPRDQDLRSWEAAVSRRTADSPVSWAGAGAGERGAGIQLRGGTPRHIFISFLLTWAGAPLWRAMGCCSHAGGLHSSCRGALPPPLQGQGHLPPPTVPAAAPSPARRGEALHHRGSAGRMGERGAAQPREGEGARGDPQEEGSRPRVSWVPL